MNQIEIGRRDRAPGHCSCIARVMGFKRLVIGLCIGLTACGGGFSTTKQVASSVKVTDETLTPDHAMTIQPQVRDGSTRKLSPIEVGYLVLEEPRFEKSSDGDLRFDANLLLKDRKSVLTQQRVTLTGTWESSEEHPVLFPDGDDDGDAPVRARLTCLEGKDGPNCERVLIDVFFKYKGQIHATQFEAQMNPHVDSDVPGYVNDDADSDSSGAPANESSPTTSDNSERGAAPVASSQSLPAAPAMGPPAQVTPSQSNPSTSTTSKPAAPAAKPSTTPAAPTVVTPKAPTPAKPAAVPAAPQVATPVKPATPAAPATSDQDDDESEDEGVDPTDHPSIYVGTLYQGADDLMKMKRPAKKATSAPTPTKKPEPAKPETVRPEPARPTPTRPSTNVSPTPAPAAPPSSPAKPATPNPSTMIPKGGYPTPPARPAGLPSATTPSTPATPVHPSSQVPSMTTPTGARPTDQAVGEPDSGFLDRASSLRDKGGPFTLLQAGRERFYATYELVDTVAYLARVCQSQPNMGPLRVGDLSQKHGGKLANSAHRSHQNGLDADLGYPVDPAYRERGFAPMVSGGVVSSALHLGETWTLFKSVWATHRMDRIFVDGHIKAALCSVASRNGDAQSSEGRELLRHLRPTPGHHNHFHLRIRCSTFHPRCRMMGEPPTGSGC